MNSPRKKSGMRSPDALCGEIGEDDLIDPRTYFDRRRSSSGKGRKSKQLCRQIERTLDATLSDGECPILEAIRIDSVQPTGGSAQLLVVVSCDRPESEVSDVEILDRLASQQGRLRSEVAASITRKRTPNLIFRVLPRDGFCESAPS